MTKLEQEIKDAIVKVPSHYDRIAVAAAEVAEMYIVKAWFNGAGYTLDVQEGEKPIDSARFCREWLKENGITE